MALSNTERLVSIAVFPILLISLFITVLGNVLVIYVIFRNKKLARKSNHYILSVAISDLLVGILTIPVGALMSYKIEHHFNLCVYMISLLIGVYSTSILSLVAVSVDRYWAVCHPISYQNNSGTGLTKLIITACWVVGMLFGSLPAMGWNNKDFDGNCSTGTIAIADFDFLLASCVMTCFGSSTVIIVLYGLIYCTIIQRAKKRSLIVGSKLNSNSCDKQEIQIAKTFAWIIGSFVVCWTPLTITFLIVYITKNRQFFFDDGWLYVFSVFAGSATVVNSAIDPIIYAYRIKDVGESMKNLVKCCRKRNAELETTVT